MSSFRRRWGRWVPDQVAVVPALWLLFGAAPAALFVTGDRGGPAQDQAAGETPAVPRAVAHPRPGLASRPPDLWPDRIGRSYYPSAAVAVEFSGRSVSRIRDATD